MPVASSDALCIVPVRNIYNYFVPVRNIYNYLVPVRDIYNRIGACPYLSMHINHNAPVRGS